MPPATPNLAFSLHPWSGLGRLQRRRQFGVHYFLLVAAVSIVTCDVLFVFTHPMQDPTPYIAPCPPRSPDMSAWLCRRKRRARTCLAGALGQPAGARNPNGWSHLLLLYCSAFAMYCPTYGASRCSLVLCSALQGLLRKLGAGFDEMMPSGGISSSQLKVGMQPA